MRNKSTNILPLKISFSPTCWDSRLHNCDSREISHRKFHSINQWNQPNQNYEIYYEIIVTIEVQVSRQADFGFRQTGLLQEETEDQLLLSKMVPTTYWAILSLPALFSTQLLPLLTDRFISKLWWKIFALGNFLIASEIFLFLSLWFIKPINFYKFNRLHAKVSLFTWKIFYILSLERWNEFSSNDSQIHQLKFFHEEKISKNISNFIEQNFCLVTPLRIKRFINLNNNLKIGRIEIKFEI